MEAFLSTLGLVFIAEVGDKSMLFSLTAATRYRGWMVLASISVATALLALLAVLVGGAAAEFLPDQLVALAAGALFIGFGIWTLLSDEDDEEVPASRRASGLRVMLFLGTVFFLAELGDKTQIATMALAGLHDGSGFAVWAGATLAMIAANGSAIAAGTQLERVLPRRVVRMAAAVVFIGFGLAALALALI